MTRREREETERQIVAELQVVARERGDDALADEIARVLLRGNPQEIHKWAEPVLAALRKHGTIK